jgi:cell division protein ZapA
MSQVNVTINGRQFRMACEDGQEEHLLALARELDTRISGLRTKFGEIGDTLQEARMTGSERSKVAQAEVANALSAAAERIETITRKLNQSISNGGAVPLG